MLWLSVLSLLSVSNSRFSLRQIASGYQCVFVCFLPGVTSHICWCKKRKNGRGGNGKYWCVCVCVVGSVTAAKSFLRLLVACVTSVFKISEVSSGWILPYWLFYWTHQLILFLVFYKYCLIIVAV